eukprot:jgi/Tetstr1/442659/TSEL_030753.t1
MNPQLAANFARTVIPAVYDELRSNLTNYVANAGEDEADIGALHLQLGDHNHVRDRIGKMAVYGELLGAAKRAIQAVVDGALPHDDLLHYLQ